MEDSEARGGESELEIKGNDGKRQSQRKNRITGVSPIVWYSPTVEISGSSGADEDLECGT